MRRGLLLDRDGIINVERGYIARLEQFEFMPGIFTFMRAAQDMGFRLAILTNQAGVARGLYTPDDYEQITRAMLKELAGQGIAIDLVLACFEHPEGTAAAYARESYWRKPNPGMVMDTVQRLNLDPARSAFLGDQQRDIQAAKAGGMAMRLYWALDGRNIPEATKTVGNYDEVCRILRDSLS